MSLYLSLSNFIFLDSDDFKWFFKLEILTNFSIAVSQVRHSHHDETADEFDARYEKFLNRKDIDGWELRKAMNDLQGHDLVPEPKIVVAAMNACRRVNDYALAVRYLEAVKVVHPAFQV